MAFFLKQAQAVAKWDQRRNLLTALRIEAQHFLVVRDSVPERDVVDLTFRIQRVEVDGAELPVPPSVVLPQPVQTPR